MKFFVEQFYKNSCKKLLDAAYTTNGLNGKDFELYANGSRAQGAFNCLSLFIGNRKVGVGNQKNGQSVYGKITMSMKKYYQMLK